MNTISIPTDLVFDYRAMSNHLNFRNDKVIGFWCSLIVHLCVLFLAGAILIKPIQFGVDQGLSGMEVQLVAGTNELVVIPTVPIVHEPVMPIIAQKDAIVQEVKEVQEIKPTTVGNNAVNVSSDGKGALTEAQPLYLRNPAPPYPMQARQRGWEGKVFLNARIDANGKPISVEIEKSSGHSSLDEAALKTVKKWQFQAAMLGAIPVESSVRVPIRFDIQNTR